MQNNKTDLPFNEPTQFTFQNFAEPSFNDYSSPVNDPLQYNIQQTNNQPGEPQQNKSIFSLGYYQDFFNVNTDEVINRIKWSMIPNPNLNFLQHYIRNKPDLYGPFWICLTLIFTIAASGNLAEYLQTAAGRNYQWKYDFHAITAAGTLILLYAWLLPLILWGILNLYGNEQCKLPLLELICVYGYCLSIFVPLSVMWIIPIHWLQWTLVCVGAVCSGTVLITSIYSAFTPKLYPILFIALMLHILLAAIFILYFFHVPQTTPILPITKHLIVTNSPPVLSALPSSHS